jgi:uncharacterized protein YkwD/DNA-directed RNA polymerase subunit RPC12/RpoP
VIRFACPSCKRILSSGDDRAGKIVRCPQCGQRMQMPRPATHITRPNRPPVHNRLTTPEKSSRRLLVMMFVVFGVLLTGASAGWWLVTRSLPNETKPNVVDKESSAPASAPVSPPTKVERDPESAEPTERKPTPSKPTTQNAPTQDTPIVQAPTAVKTPPPPREEKKDIALSEEPPPELPFDLEDAINVQRERSGQDPIFLDPELSRACQAEAERLARNGGPLRDDPKTGKLAGSIHAADAPSTAVEKWLREPRYRSAILEPRLRTLGAGFARNVEGQWFSVFDWTQGIDRTPSLEAASVTPAIVYPAMGQTRVPLWFPGNETPDPLPDTKNKLAGFPITLTFTAETRIEVVTAHLTMTDEREIEVWLSSPEKPANPRFAPAQRNTICLIAKQPLRPNTRYRVAVSAMVNGEPWSAKWDFHTVSGGEIHHEMAGSLLRRLNRLRRRAGLSLVRIDAEACRACAAHAHYLGLNTPTHPTLNWNAEQQELPGYTEEGAAAARTAAIQGGGGPVEAVNGLIDSLISRPQVLNPRLHAIGLGYTPFAFGGWIWVIQPRLAAARAGDKEYFYPAPDQEGVPFMYPPNEVPSPIPPETRSKKAGYAITALFGPGADVSAATVKLIDDKSSVVEGWLSSPEKPAIAGFSQHSLCFLPRDPLRPDTRYTITFEAKLNGRPWQRTWSFTTLKEPDRYSDDLPEKIVAKLNAVRKAAGLKAVRLDPELSQGCQSHARYLALNHQRSVAQGMNVHREDADLPGASAEGAKAAKESVIAVLLDPQSCVENWMATLYHRAPLLEPSVERVGFGHAQINGHKWACVLDIGNGRASAKEMP